MKTLIILAIMLLGSVTACNKNEDVIPDIDFAGQYRFEVFGWNQMNVLSVNGEKQQYDYLNGQMHQVYWTNGVPYDEKFRLRVGDTISFNCEWMSQNDGPWPLLEVYRDSVLIYQSNVDTTNIKYYRWRGYEIYTEIAY